MATYAMPDFPTIDLSPSINWVVNGVMGMFSSNIALVITAGLALSVIFVVPRFTKRLGHSAVKG